MCLKRCVLNSRHICEVIDKIVPGFYLHLSKNWHISFYFSLYIIFLSDYRHRHSWWLETYENWIWLFCRCKAMSKIWMERQLPLCLGSGMKACIMWMEPLLKERDLISQKLICSGSETNLLSSLLDIISHASQWHWMRWLLD